jgi:hypothetical protein
MLKPVGHHERNQPCVMDFNTLHSIGHDELSPQGIGSTRLAQDGKLSLKSAHPPIRLFDRKSVSSAGCRGSCANVPEFSYVLGRSDRDVASALEFPNSLPDVDVIWIRPVQESEENSRVDQDLHQG